jgi:hypothetical protein
MLADTPIRVKGENMTQDKEQNDFECARVGAGLGCSRAFPATHRACPSTVRQKAMLALLVACMTTLPSLAAEPELPAIACRPLMLDEECRAYIANMGQATTPSARDAIKAHYELLLQAREQSCQCNLGNDGIRIRQPQLSPLTLTLLNRG